MHIYIYTYTQIFIIFVNTPAHMVRLVETTSINANKFPVLSDWDAKVRKNFNLYQRLIDQKTYQLQRIQRYIFSAQYPQKYDSDLITLNLLRKKQRVGEVTKQQVDLYESINPSIRTQFHRTFNTFVDLPFLGIALGTGLFLYGTLFGLSIPTRIVYAVLPIWADYYRTRRSPSSEIQTSELLDWTYQYRKARAFNQRYKHLFSNAETRKILGQHGNLVALGDQLVKMAK